MIETRESYTIKDVRDVVNMGPVLGCVTNALTGRTTAFFRVGGKAVTVVIGEPLCMASDKPVADCQCEACSGGN